MSRYLKKIMLISNICLLSSCYLFSAPSTEHIRPFYNKYDTYSEMQEHLIILNKNIPEKKQFYFDFTLNGYKTDYYVAGIDRCYSMYLIDSYEDHDKNRCNYMEYREIYYELSNKNLIVTISFAEKTHINQNDIYWTDENLGLYRGTWIFDLNGKGDKFFLVNSTNEIIALKFNVKNVDKAIVKTFQDAITKTVLENI